VHLAGDAHPFLGYRERRERVKDEIVAIKMHTGNNLAYSTIHPVFVRKVVQAVKDGGGHPFVVDVSWDVSGAELRGYSQETLGCPVYPSAGLKDRYFYTHERPYKNIQVWKIAGMIEDASFLVNFAHVKGHPFSQLHGRYKDPYKVVEYGEALGLGSRQYKLVDVQPLEQAQLASLGYISAN
jgi:uncharacterized Fe-S center protein